MKISYERLNEIIEDEVLRFKKLNEQAGSAMTVDQKLKLVKDKISRLSASDASTIDQILSIIGTGK